MKSEQPVVVDPRTRALWMGIKRAIGMLIAAFDEYFGVDAPGR